MRHCMSSRVNLAKVGIVFAVTLMVATASFAIEPAYTGKLGNPEEPATRPYKAMWRGMKAMHYHTVKSFEEGNKKVPGWGSVEMFRGMRRGAVEFADSTYRGMAGEQAPPVKQECKVNKALDRDPVTRGISDGIHTSLVFASLMAPPPVVLLSTANVCVAQYLVDREGERQEQALLDQARTRQVAKGRFKPVPIMYASDSAKESKKTRELAKADGQTDVSLADDDGAN
ncbi:MAG: hypothetical protein GY851_03520 [bacterium]|nr:hypothetical protein [bacterium]